MEITSLQYLLFTISVISCFHFLNDKSKKWLLLISSYIFYGTYSLTLLTALIISTIINYYISTLKTKYLLGIIIGFNLSLLLLFKVGNLLNDSSILIPIGISFFTFQAIGYGIDNSKKKIVIEHKLVDFANFLSFFPQLIAGPIESFNKLGKQLITLQKGNWQEIQGGLYLIAIGLAQKLIIADRCGVFVDHIYSDVSQANFISFAIAILLFSFQIFLDFSAYCNISIGIAKCLGINLTSNFNSPYLSSNISSFWRNWHITLHLWFKSYLFAPIKQHTNWLIATFFIFIISGIWHGIASNYILWGLFSFLTFLIDRFLIQKVIKNKYASTVLTFILISIGWVFFRIENIEDLLYLPLNINKETIQGFNQTILDFHYVLQTSIQLLGLEK